MYNVVTVVDDKIAENVYLCLAFQPLASRYLPDRTQILSLIFIKNLESVATDKDTAAIWCDAARI